MLEYIILGFLMEKELSGYDLKQIMSESTSYFFDASFGSIYPALKRLETKGYIHYHEVIDGNKLKKLYSITNTGKEVFLEWLKKPINFSKTNRELLAKFVETNRINKFVSIDEDNNFIKISDIRKGGDVIENVYATDEIMQFELLEDGESIASGGLGRAVVGGALFGATGAIVGGITGKKTTRKVVDTFKIKITFNNINNPLEYVNLINAKTKTNSSIYQNACNEAQEILSVLSIIIKNNDKADNEQSKTSDSIEQVKGLKELLDLGAITEEEFNTKKKELLNL
ncbi:helix-turn-helix transcriptional regulator [Clostridioides difficile]|uniref:helix-turn-helix transcriptional regulator n=2 Tax=Clostridioides difficile TaxID=1496 RepID=UPI00115E5E5D|nr:helix-turn-helix transcriptional regulator [Clostridioides difficile]TQW48753.1 hypothetical protein D1N85_03855 [Clostridioides difficile]